MKSIKLICLNVGLFEENNKKLYSFFKEQKPDILCLQEVTRRVDKTAHETYISINPVDEATRDLKYSFYAPNVVLQHFKQNDFHGKEVFEMHFNGFLELGNYFRSRFEITKGYAEFIKNHFTYLTDWSEWPKKEQKAVQVVDLQVSRAKKLRVLNYHGIWSRDKKGTDITKAVSEKILELATEVSYPSIIAGDFNLFPHTASMEVLNKKFISLVDKYKIRTTRPASNELSREKRNVVDYIFASRDIKIKDFKVIESEVSDHLPLVLEFTF